VGVALAGGARTEGETDTTNRGPSKGSRDKMSFALGTTCFIGLEVVFVLFVSVFWKAGQRQLQHLLFSASVFCCWLMWAIIYMAQMNPLVNPVLAGVD